MIIKQEVENLSTFWIKVSMIIRKLVNICSNIFLKLKSIKSGEIDKKGKADLPTRVKIINTLDLDKDSNNE